MLFIELLSLVQQNYGNVTLIFVLRFVQQSEILHSKTHLNHFKIINSTFQTMTFEFFNVKVTVLVAQLCPTLCNPTDCSPSSSSVHGILQARILEWVVIPFSTQKQNPGLLHHRQIPYCLSHQGSPIVNAQLALFLTCSGRYVIQDRTIKTIHFLVTIFCSGMGL